MAAERSGAPYRRGMPPASLTEAVVALALTLTGMAPVAAANSARPWFNEQMVQGLYRELPVEDPMAIFRYVFGHLADEVFVYPTENYYYFNFSAGGRTFSGNFRLAPDARAQSRLHFAYFDTSDPAWFRYVYLGPEHGLKVVEIGP